MASARLRKTFQYPDDSDHDDDSTRAEMDEEEQEQLITNMRKQDQERNEQYTLIFTILPLVATLALLPSFLAPSSPGRVRILSLLSMTSLLSTAWISKYIPPSPPASSDQASGNLALLSGLAPSGDGPVQQYLVYLDVVMCLLLGLAAWGLKGRDGREAGFWILCLVPGVVFVVVMVARWVMTSVDVGELERLRYRYKGA